MAISEEIRKNLIIGGGFGGFQDPFNLPPAAKPPQGKLDAFLGSPGGSMLMNLLAQSGYSTMPQSPFGAIGRAALMTQQQQQQRGMSDLQRQLIESTIGLNQAKALGEGGGPQIGNIDPSKFTAESLRSFQQTGDLGSLRPIGQSGADLNKIVNEIADDARAESKDFVQQQASFGRIQAAASNPSAFGDLALIFNFMKVLDPGSTVREGEFANAQNSGGVPDRFRALYNNVLEGTRLSDPQRADLLAQASRIYNSAAKDQQKRNERFRSRGRNAQLPDAFIDPILVPAELIDIATSSVVDDPLTPPTDDEESEGAF